MSRRNDFEKCSHKFATQKESKSPRHIPLSLWIGKKDAVFLLRFWKEKRSSRANRRRWSRGFVRIATTFSSGDDDCALLHFGTRFVTNGFGKAAKNDGLGVVPQNRGVCSGVGLFARAHFRDHTPRSLAGGGGSSSPRPKRETTSLRKMRFLFSPVVVLRNDR